MTQMKFKWEVGCDDLGRRWQNFASCWLPLKPPHRWKKKAGNFNWGECLGSPDTGLIVQIFCWQATNSYFCWFKFQGWNSLLVSQHNLVTLQWHVLLQVHATQSLCTCHLFHLQRVKIQSQPMGSHPQESPSYFIET